MIMIGSDDMHGRFFLQRGMNRDSLVFAVRNFTRHGLAFTDSVDELVSFGVNFAVSYNSIAHVIITWKYPSP